MRWKRKHSGSEEVILRAESVGAPPACVGIRDDVLAVVVAGLGASLQARMSLGCSTPSGRAL